MDTKEEEEAQAAASAEDPKAEEEGKTEEKTAEKEGGGEENSAEKPENGHGKEEDKEATTEEGTEEEKAAEDPSSPTEAATEENPAKPTGGLPQISSLLSRYLPSPGPITPKLSIPKIPTREAPAAPSPNASPPKSSSNTANAQDNISVALVRKLAECIKDKPKHFRLDFDETRSLEAVEYAGEMLQATSSIEWLEVEFRPSAAVSVQSMSQLVQFVSHSNSLKILEVTMVASAVPAGGQWDEITRLFLLAVAQNSSLEKISLQGKPCEHVGELFKFMGSTCHIQELSLEGFPDNVATAFTPNHSLHTLTLKPGASKSYKNPLSPDGQPGLTAILDKFASSSSFGYGIRDLTVQEWSWSLSKFLQSPNSAVEKLTISKVDFRHDRLSGMSPMDVFLIGLKGSKNTTTLTLDQCLWDKRATEKLLIEFDAGSLSVTTLRLNGMEVEASQISQVFLTRDLHELSFEGVTKMVESNMDVIADAITNCTLTSLAIPVERIGSLAPALQVATTTRSLNALQITDTRLEEGDVDALCALLQDERCQLRGVSLEYHEGFFPKIVQSMAGEHSKLETIRLKDYTGKSLKDVVDALVTSIGKEEPPKWKHVTLVCCDLTAKMEEQLLDALEDNWTLETLTLERLVLEGDTKKRHQCEPVTSTKFQTRLDKWTRRNKEKRFGPTRSMSFEDGDTVGKGVDTSNLELDEINLN